MCWPCVFCFLSPVPGFQLMGKCNEKVLLMESPEELKVTERKKALEHWLCASRGWSSVSLQPMVGDASFRRYFRLYTPSGSFVVMDAPPQENTAAFVAIAKALRAMTLQTPEILEANLEQGFLLLTDFGDLTYLKALTDQNADKLYQAALSTLAHLQECREVPAHSLPVFNNDFMLQEWAWHKEWFLDKLLGLAPIAHEKALDHCFQLLVESAVNQPQVFMHRDYHSANLMVLPDHQVGLLDFQDAFIGPVTYDVVSLLRDCYITWPQERVQQWALSFLQKRQALGAMLDVEQQEFLRWFDLMGLERHLKALMTFARKHVRDHHSHYLTYIPATLNYVLTVSQRYPELSALHHYFQATVQPAFARMELPCEA